MGNPNQRSNSVPCGYCSHCDSDWFCNVSHKGKTVARNNLTPKQVLSVRIRFSCEYVRYSSIEASCKQFYSKMEEKTKLNKTKIN